MSDLYVGEYPIDMTPEEARAELARRAAMTNQPNTQGNEPARDDLVEAMQRVKLVADGGTINGSYSKMPMAALIAFRADLFAMLEALQSRTTSETNSEDAFVAGAKAGTGNGERAQIVAWMKRAAEVCDCFARSQNDCVCGAWHDDKTMRVVSLIEGIERGDHLPRATKPIEGTGIGQQ